MFWKRTCEWLCGLLTFIGFGWHIIVVSTVNLGLLSVTASRCLTFPALQEVTWSHGQVLANTHSFPPVPAFGSIWVVLWLLFFRSTPSTFPQVGGYLLGTFFRESLVMRLYSEIGQIHLSIEVQCGSVWKFVNSRIIVQEAQATQATYIL